jgi:hypothetical protein
MSHSVISFKLWSRAGLLDWYKERRTGSAAVLRNQIEIGAKAGLGAWLGHSLCIASARQMEGEAVTNPQPLSRMVGKSTGA